MPAPKQTPKRGRTAKRTTVSFDPWLYQALRIKAVETDRSVSDLVNSAVRHSLAEDNEDLAAFEERDAEPTLAFAGVLKDLKAASPAIACSSSLRPSKTGGDPHQGRRKLITRIEALASEPRPHGSEKLSGLEQYRVRQGNYRVVYGVDDVTRLVLVVKAGHRRDVYR